MEEKNMTERKKRNDGEKIGNVRGKNGITKRKKWNEEEKYE